MRRPKVSSVVRALSAAFAVAALGGATLIASAEPLALRAAPFLAIALLGLSVRLASRISLLATGGAGLVFGTVAHALTLGKLVPLCARFLALPEILAVLAAVLVWVVHALPFALSALGAELGMRRAGTPRFVLLPLWLTLSLSICPRVLPFQLGELASDSLRFAQIAELGGAPLVTLCMALTALALLELALARRLLVGPLVCVALSLGAPLVYGELRLTRVRAERKAAPVLRVGLAQSNVSVRERERPAGAELALARLREDTRQLEARGAELVVWGETAYPYRLSARRTLQPEDARRIVDGELRGPVLFGALSYETLRYSDVERNSAFVVDEAGTLRGRVDKERLIPFAEYVPLFHTFSAVRAHFGSAGLSAGQGGVLYVRGEPLGILICYEDLFSDSARRRVREGASVLVNLTNDAWFGDSVEPAMHDLAARMRAFETRRDLVRVTNTGVSSFTAATGERIAHTQLLTRASLLAEVRPLRTRTWSVRLGDWVTPLCLLAIAALSARKRRSLR